RFDPKPLFVQFHQLSSSKLGGGAIIMFSRMFGKPKEDSSALTTLDKLNETLEMLEKKEAVLLRKAGQEVEKAKEYTRAKNKR
ncbi:hypothetical protein MKX03_022175, partial [Papaver bracteatum]